jgi:hypothetical protein
MSPFEMLAVLTNNSRYVFWSTGNGKEVGAASVRSCSHSGHRNMEEEVTSNPLPLVLNHPVFARRCWLFIFSRD